MPIFAPAYRPTKHQQTFVTRQQNLESKKRKRGDNDDDVVQISSDSDDPSRPSHPVNRKDPYFIAGLSREDALPPPPFPHAAVKEASKKKIPIEEELAGLNPPLYVPPKVEEDKSTSLKRRHLDNLTAILHKCMLNGDWPRAYRAWSLLLRTEIAGRGIDVRRNGRWGIGAELLMRRDATKSQEAKNDTDEDFEDAQSLTSSKKDVPQSRFTDEGFKLAREYYERLILQYPHTPYTQNSLNAAAIYPVLFNVWIYEVQDRSKRARQELEAAPDSRPSSRDSAQSGGSDRIKKPQLQRIRFDELEQASSIADRMDELLLGPPYDTNTTLLQLRGMVALWLSDLHSELAGTNNDSTIDSDGSSNIDLNSGSTQRHRTDGLASRRKAKEIFSRLEASGIQLPPEATMLSDEESD